ncbi:hypothetical protein [Tenacibaculum sp.]|uniref:hypothetical protein n=1 Tax=Tenacibaculum sp. TaxID=1906242 RepID=UPI003D0B557D
MSIFTKEVLDPVHEAIHGNPTQIPIHLQRVSEFISIRQSIYTIVGGNSGSGKTSFVDDTFVLKPFDLWDKYKDTTDITFRVLYRSMERKRRLKLAKWACWKMYQTYGLLTDAETLLGYKKSKISKDIWDKLVECRDWADRLLDYIDIRDGRSTPLEYNDWVTKHALRHGELFISNSIGVFNAKDPNTMIDHFFKGKTIVLDNGDKEPIVEFEFKGKKYHLKEGEKRYFPKREKEITVVIADHVGKFNPDPGSPNKKSIVDKASEFNSDFRDVFGYSPVAVSQFNRATGDIQRIKHAQNDLSPQLEDFKDTNGLVEDCDVALTIFNPFRYKAYDEDGMYKGYSIRDRMVSPLGYNRYRLLSILKNSYGIDDVDFGLKFLGEVNNFTTLPKPNEDGGVSAALQKAYLEIENGY